MEVLSFFVVVFSSTFPAWPMSLVYRARFLFVLFGKGREQKDSIGEEALWVFFFLVRPFAVVHLLRLPAVTRKLDKLF